MDAYALDLGVDLGVGLGVGRSSSSSLVYLSYDPFLSRKPEKKDQKTLMGRSIDSTERIYSSSKMYDFIGGKNSGISCLDDHHLH